MRDLACLLVSLKHNLDYVANIYIVSILAIHVDIIAFKKPPWRRTVLKLEVGFIFPTLP